MNRSHLVALPTLWANAAAIHAVFLVFTDMSAPAADTVGLLVWLLCLGLTYTALTLFLRKERSLRGVILIAIAGFALQLMLSLAVGVRCPSALSWLFLLLFWAVMHYRSYLLLRTAAPPEQLVLSFEGTAAALLLTAFFVSSQLMSPLVLLHLGLGLGCNLLALARQRAGGNRVGTQCAKHRGKGLLILLPVAVGGVAALCAAAFTQGAGKAVAWLGQTAKSVGLAVFGAVEEFFRFLATLLPEDELGELELSGPGGGLPDSGGADMMEQFQSDALLYAFLIVGILGALFALAYYLRHPGKGRRVRFVPALRRQRRTGGGFQALWQKLLQALRLRWRYLRCRNTPPGLFLWLERRYHRRKEESPRVFLARCEKALPHCSGELAQLADWLDEYYFAPQTPHASLPVREIRKKCKEKR